MRIMVTGSSGFIGSHLTQLLADQGHEVVGFDLVEPAEDYGIAKFVRGDIRDRQDLLQALEGIDVVVNLAAIHFDFGHAEQEYWDTNEGGSHALLSAMSEAGVSRFIFTSSIAVYGDRTDEANEESDPTPTNTYGQSKLAAEKVVHKWAEEDPNRSVVIIRPCVVYGERNITNMLNLIRQINSGYFVLFGSGENIKATAYVGNLTQAIHFQLERLEPGIKTYNYADKPDLSVGRIVSIIREALGKSPRPLRFPVSLGLVAAIPFEAVTKLTGKNLPVSMARVKKLAQPTQVAADRIRETGFKQPISSEEGLRRMVRYFQSQRSKS